MDISPSTAQSHSEAASPPTYGPSASSHPVTQSLLGPAHVASCMQALRDLLLVVQEHQSGS